LSSLKAGDYRAATVTAEGLAKDRDESLRFLEWAGIWYRDLMVHAVTRGSSELVNRDVLAWMEHESADDRLEHSLSLIAQTIEPAPTNMVTRSLRPPRRRGWTPKHLPTKSAQPSGLPGMTVDSLTIISFAPPIITTSNMCRNC